VSTALGAFDRVLSSTAYIYYLEYDEETSVDDIKGSNEIGPAVHVNVKASHKVSLTCARYHIFPAQQQY
jgi:hypothetical protein